MSWGEKKLMIGKGGERGWRGEYKRERDMSYIQISPPLCLELKGDFQIPKAERFLWRIAISLSSHPSSIRFIYFKFNTIAEEKMKNKLRAEIKMQVIERNAGFAGNKLKYIISCQLGGIFHVLIYQKSFKTLFRKWFLIAGLKTFLT